MLATYEPSGPYRGDLEDFLPEPSDEDHASYTGLAGQPTRLQRFLRAEIDRLM